MKLEIKLDPQDIDEIAQKLADIILRSFMEVESRIRPPQQPPTEKPLVAKYWKSSKSECEEDPEVAFGLAYGDQSPELERPLSNF